MLQKRLFALLLCGVWAISGCATTTSEPLPAANKRFADAGQHSEPLYEAMMGEFSLFAGELDKAYQHTFKAAELSGDALLYERALQIAGTQNNLPRIAEAVQSWLAVDLDSDEANRYALELLLKQKKYEQAAPHLERILASIEEAKDANALVSLGQQLTPHAQDIVAVYQQSLAPFLESGDDAMKAAAWLSLGVLQSATPQKKEALQTLMKAHQLDLQAIEPLLFMISLISPDLPEAERFILDYFDQPKSSVHAHLAYIQSLFQKQKIPEAATQLEKAAKRNDALPIVWFLLGSLEMETGEYGAAVSHLKMFLNKTEGDQSENTQGNRESTYLRLAQAEVELGRYSAAMQWIEQVEAPEVKAQALQSYIGLLLNAGQADLALTVVGQLPEKSVKEKEEKQVLYIQTLIKAKRWDEVDRYITGLNTQDSGLRYMQAAAALNAKRFAKAETILRQLIDENPENAAALNALGYSIVLRDGDLQEAKKLIQQALDIQPNDPAMLDSLAWVEYKLGNLELATYLIKRSYAQFPDPEVASHYGEILWVQGQQDQAIAIWQKTYFENPDDQELLQTLKRLGADPERLRRIQPPKRVEASTSLQQEARQIPSNESGRMANLILHLYETQDWLGLYELLEPLNASLDKPDEILLQMQADAATELAYVDEAEKIYRQLLTLSTDNASVYNNFGYLLLEQTERYQEAKELIETANRLAPDQGYILDSLGWAEYKLGNMEQALVHLNRAYELDASIPDIGIHLGEVLWKTGERFKALEVWAKVAENSPSNSLLIETLRRLEVTLP